MEMENTALLSKEERAHKQFTKLVIENNDLIRENKRLKEENGYLKELDMQHNASKAELQELVKDLYNRIYVLNGGDIHTMIYRQSHINVDKR